MNTQINALFSMVKELKATLQQLEAKIEALTAEKSTQTKPAPKPQQDSILRLPQVLQIVGISKTGLYQRIKDGLFPRQVKLGERCSGWFASEIYAFVQSLVDQRTANLNILGNKKPA